MSPATPRKPPSCGCSSRSAPANRERPPAGDRSIPGPPEPRRRLGPAPGPAQRCLRHRSGLYVLSQAGVPAERAEDPTRSGLPGGKPASGWVLADEVPRSSRCKALHQSGPYHVFRQRVGHAWSDAVRPPPTKAAAIRSRPGECFARGSSGFRGHRSFMHALRWVSVGMPRIDQCDGPRVAVAAFARSPPRLIGLLGKRRSVRSGSDQARRTRRRP